MSGGTYPWRLFGLNILITLGILLALEIWRPFFFLTDDNLTSTLPLFFEVGQHLGHAESPFVSQYIFNGNYNLLRDISYLDWHPLYLTTSLLANFSALKYSIIDLDCWLLFVLTTTGFTALAVYLREIYDLKLTNGQITLFATSYTWSMFALVVSCSWITFMGSISGLPWIALGLFQKRLRIGLLITTLALLHTVLSGHAEPLITSLLTLTCLVGGICLYRHNLQPLLVWIDSLGLTTVILLPFLVPAVDGYLHTVRGSGLPLAELSLNSIPAWRLILGYFLGPWAHFISTPAVTFTAAQFYLAGLTGCLASWCIFPALIRKVPWTTLHVTCAIIIALLILFIAQPTWLAELMDQLPLLNSLRWPFRDALQLIFFIHLFLLIRSQAPTLADKYIAGASVLAFILGLCSLRNEPPSFNPLPQDRKLVLSGVADTYWNRVKLLLDPTVPILSVTSPELSVSPSLPFSLMGSSNYGQLFGVKNYYGYSTTAPDDQVPSFTHLTYRVGKQDYREDTKAIFIRKGIREIHLSSPAQRFNIIMLESLSPLRIKLIRPDGVVIDITPRE